MTSVVELFPKSRKLAYDARQQLSQVQNGVLYPSELYLSLDELTRQLDIMDTLVNRETPLQRENWKRKIMELREESSSIRMLCDRHDRLVNMGVKQAREREELLNRRRRRQQNNDPQQEEDEMKQLLRENESLTQSQAMVGDLLGSGQATLTNLVEQRQRLGGVKKTLLAIGNSLGLSRSTMRIIERRDITDAYLVFAGMIVTCIVIYILWWVI